MGAVQDITKITLFKMGQNTKNYRFYSSNDLVLHYNDSGYQHGCKLYTRNLIFCYFSVFVLFHWQYEILKKQKSHQMKQEDLELS